MHRGGRVCPHVLDYAQELDQCSGGNHVGWHHDRKQLQLRWRNDNGLAMTMDWYYALHIRQAYWSVGAFYTQIHVVTADAPPLRSQSQYIAPWALSINHSRTDVVCPYHIQCLLQSFSWRRCVCDDWRLTGV